MEKHQNTETGHVSQIQTILTQTKGVIQNVMVIYLKKIHVLLDAVHVSRYGYQLKENHVACDGKLGHIQMKKKNHVMSRMKFGNFLKLLMFQHDLNCRFKFL